MVVDGGMTIWSCREGEPQGFFVLWLHFVFLSPPVLFKWDREYLFRFYLHSGFVFWRLYPTFVD